jgi:hypothetical protein
MYEQELAVTHEEEQESRQEQELAGMYEKKLAVTHEEEQESQQEQVDHYHKHYSSQNLPRPC